MADKKISALTDIGTGIASGDYLLVIDDPTGTPTSCEDATQCPES